MRTTLKALGLGLALAAAGLFALHRARAQDGQPDASGTWEGKIAFRFYPLDPQENTDKGRLDATMTISQSGADVTIAMTVQAPEGPQPFTLTGLVGNGNLWAFNNDSVNPMLIVGHFGGSDQSLKMRGSGVLAQAAESNEIKFNFRRTGTLTKR